MEALMHLFHQLVDHDARFTIYIMRFVVCT
jgi:hypothetical protein